MPLTERRRKVLYEWALKHHRNSRQPDFTVTVNGEDYLQRWFVVRSGRRWLDLTAQQRSHILAIDPRKDSDEGRNVFLHVFKRSDTDRALHDHPWDWRTIILSGSYIEHIPRDNDKPTGPTKRFVRREGDIVKRAAHTPHRVELIDRKPVVSLFITHPKTREWGFWCEQGWRYWRHFIDDRDNGTGSGCG